MGVKARFYVMAAIGVVTVLVLGRIGADWSKAEFYAACAGVIVLGSTVGPVWVHLAPDGDLRRPRN